MSETILETVKHIRSVQGVLNLVVRDLLERSRIHDQSKLEDPEKEIFDKFTPLLADSTFGSDEYMQFLKDMKPALDHHYSVNSHHPEHYKNGMDGMTLIDLIEMFCDWSAAVKRHKDGDLLRSIEINQKRFGYSDGLKEILKNTAEYFSKGDSDGLSE